MPAKIRVFLIRNIITLVKKSLSFNGNQFAKNKQDNSRKSIFRYSFQFLERLYFVGACFSLRLLNNYVKLRWIMLEI